VTYTFKKASQLGSLQDWGARSVAYAYWPDGLVRSATNPDATTTSYAYDNARRLVDIAHASPSGQLIGCREPVGVIHGHARTREGIER